MNTTFFIFNDPCYICLIIVFILTCMYPAYTCWQVSSHITNTCELLSKSPSHTSSLSSKYMTALTENAYTAAGGSSSAVEHWKIKIVMTQQLPASLFTFLYFCLISITSKSQHEIRNFKTKLTQDTYVHVHWHKWYILDNWYVTPEREKGVAITTRS